MLRLKIFCGAKVRGKEWVKRGKGWSLLPPAPVLPASLAVHTLTHRRAHARTLRASFPFAEQGEGEERRKPKCRLFMFRDVTPLIFHAG